MAKRPRHVKLRLVGAEPAERPSELPGVVVETTWHMKGLRGEPGLLGRSNGHPAIERRDSKAQVISLGALEAITSHLTDKDALTVRLSMTTQKSGTLEAIVAAHGASTETAEDRRRSLNSGLEAVFKTTLPHVEMAESSETASVALPFQQVLCPVGEVLAVADGGPAPARVGQRSFALLEMPALLSPADLHHLASHISALKCDLTLSLSVSPVELNADLRAILDRALEAARQKRIDDVNTYYQHNEQTASAIDQLERLLFAGRGMRLTATVGASRALNEVELSLLSSAIFGSPHRTGSRGSFNEVSQLYVSEAAAFTLLGFTLAAVAPCHERREVAELETLAGLVIGKTENGHLVRMAVENPRNHTYTIGRSGTGKSTLIINMAVQDAIDGRAVVVVDPHGDLCDDIYMRLPKERMKDVVYYHCADPNSFPLLNPLQRRSGADQVLETSRVVDATKRMIRRVLYPGYDPDAFGPMYEDLIQAVLYLLIEAMDDEARVTDVERVVTDATWRHELLRRQGVSAETKRKWSKFEAVSENWHKLESLAPYVTSKVAVFTQNQLIRPILDGRELAPRAVAKHTLDFDKVLGSKKIVLINLAVTQMGEAASTLLGGLVTMKLYDAAKRQPRDTKNERPSAAIYLDEFQTYATELLADMMAETRKFGLRIMLANQTLGQLRARGRDHLHAILGNSGNIVLFGVDTEDAVYLSQRFPGMIQPSRLASLANYEAICRFQTKTKAYGPLQIRTLVAPDPLRPAPVRNI